MFKEMRRKDREIERLDAEKILNREEYGILSTVCNDGYAYGTPLNYIYKDNNIYFHCANEGQKLENIESNNKVCFTVVGCVEVLPDKFSTNYESVVVFGTAVPVQEAEKEEALTELIKKYSKDYMAQGLEYIKKAINAVSVYKINIEHMSAKARR